ncbi:MAG TPA: hypothetical protein P5332_10845 [Ignavibacteriales bacterium]|nr:hypothetical protein [Ignavibacteriales bacterium]
MKGKGYIVENGYVISEHICQPNPEVPGEFLAPSNYVEINKVPECGQDEIVFYDSVTKKCHVVSNYLGKDIYNKQNSRIRKINTTIELEDGYTDNIPPDGDIIYHYTDTGWIVDHDNILAKALEKNSMTYMIICTSTDAEINKYAKRSELNILYPEDEQDYQNAMQTYREATLNYKQTKAQLTTMSDSELLAYYKSQE